MTNYSRWTKLLHIHWFIYVLLAAGLAGLGVYDLRQNNLEMAELKEAVITADEEGEDITPALRDLSSYVFNHMNTSTQITLASEYSRDAEAVIEASRPDDTNKQVYEQARRECENPNIPLTARASCVAEYVSANSPDSQPAEINLPPESSYKFSFLAPTWSADLAGLSLLASVGMAGLGVYSWIKSE